MAPDTVARWLEELPAGATVLDPMCGSGVVVRQAALLGHTARGFDLDPLAVLMSKVWTRDVSARALTAAAETILRDARRSRLSYRSLPWVKDCPETADFIAYWFAEPQRAHLARISAAIRARTDNMSPRIRDALWLALSRTIITKHSGASLAWDVSHSRPHKVRDTNPYDVMTGFLRSAVKLGEVIQEVRIAGDAKVRAGDCRSLAAIDSESIDAVVTSPPYLNAIDYLRGHKLSLVWMGHSIPDLRTLRSGAIGTERARGAALAPTADADFEKDVRFVRRLPDRERAIVHKYAADAGLMIDEMDRVLKSRGLLLLVLGDSNLKGVPVKNSQVFRWIAERRGFELREELRRPLATHKRYLPIRAETSALRKRMKHEVIQVYRARR